jgi:hypothetical protein
MFENKTQMFETDSSISGHGTSFAWEERSVQGTVLDQSFPSSEPKM